jgi:hypothetical protein
MLVDQRTENVYVPLNALSQTHKLELANSSLSEMAVLGVSVPPLCEIHYLMVRSVRAWDVLGVLPTSSDLGGTIRRFLQRITGIMNVQSSMT